MNYNALLCLQLFLTKGLGRKGINKLFDRMELEDFNSSSFFNSSPDEFACKYNLPQGMAQAIAAAEGHAETCYNRLLDNGITILARPLHNYPLKLTHVLRLLAPPLLFAKGNLEILELSSIGFCGSRKVSETGILITRQLTQMLSENRICIVSGYAKGVDLAAHRSALEYEGKTIFVLAEGIMLFRAKKEICDFMNEDNSLILSEFAPVFSWSVRNAMQRNATIIGLSDAIVLVESGLEGGTFAAGESALELKRSLFAVKYQNPPESAKGNIHFINKGAFPLIENDNEITNQDILLGFSSKEIFSPVQALLEF